MFSSSRGLASVHILALKAISGRILLTWLDYDGHSHLVLQPNLRLEKLGFMSNSLDYRSS
jgi:hypothetical protein